MKKLTIIFISLVMLLSSGGCSQNNNTDSKTDNTHIEAEPKEEKSQANDYKDKSLLHTVEIMNNTATVTIPLKWSVQDPYFYMEHNLNYHTFIACMIDENSYRFSSIPIEVDSIYNLYNAAMPVHKQNVVINGIDSYYTSEEVTIDGIVGNLAIYAFLNAHNQLCAIMLFDDSEARESRMDDFNRMVETLTLSGVEEQVNEINSKLDEVEASNNPELFDQLSSTLKQFSYNPVYKEYKDVWNSRIEAVSNSVEQERKAYAARQKEKEIQDFKDSCVSPDYKDFFRHSDEYKDSNLCFTGEVRQIVTQDSSGAEFLMDVTLQGEYYTYYSDPVYVTYDNSSEINATKILEGDIVTVWGYGEDDYSYITVLGSTNTVPAMKAIESVT